jgi:hypothetical protein
MGDPPSQGSTLEKAAMRGTTKQILYYLRLMKVYFLILKLHVSKGVTLWFLKVLQH